MVALGLDFADYFYFTGCEYCAAAPDIAQAAAVVKVVPVHFHAVI
jgi:hypothetical protein